MKQTLALLLVFLLTLSTLASCGTVTQADPIAEGKVKEHPGEISENFPEKTAAFAFSLFDEIIRAETDEDIEKNPNRLYSPISALLCLALVGNGTDGEARADFEKAIGMTVEEMNDSLGVYAAKLESADGFMLHTANSLWLRDFDANGVHKDYLDTVTSHYDAQIFSEPFNDETVKKINAWCKQHTDGMIDEIIKEIDPRTIAYLVNAVAFEAKWYLPYEPEQIKENAYFYTGNENQTVTMLSSTESVYLENDDCIGFSKLYKGGKFAFVGLLPSEGISTKDLLLSMNGEKWFSLFEKASEETVKVQMPMFTFDKDMKLKEPLKAFGLDRLFSPGAFGAMFDDQSVYLSSVEQKTFIELNADGTKAAAVTWGEMRKNAAEPDPQIKSVILNRPFVFAIVDTETSLPLFLGSVDSIS